MHTHNRNGRNYSSEILHIESLAGRSDRPISTRAHHRDEKRERDLTYHLTCLLIYDGTTTHLSFVTIFLSK